MELSDWLDSAPEADWGPRLLRLASRGALGRAPGGLLLDLPALAQRYGCVSGQCTPGRRAPGARSCCADLEVEPDDAERAAILAALPELARAMAPVDSRWRGGPPELFEGPALRRPSRRCVFAVETKDGLRCGLHALEDVSGRPRGALKPLSCRLFPLVLVGLDDGRTLVSAIARDTARLAGSRPARAFPCLGAASTSVAEGCADTLRELFGARTARAILRAVGELGG